VLGKALFRAVEKLGLKQDELAAILGVSPATLSRRQAARVLDPNSKEGELGLQVVRIFRSLDALFGGNERQSACWFASENQHLGGVPRELVRNVLGLIHVADYLDAMRGKN
jgi:transcriptional regulator with XRE-family HTH domain